MQTAMVETLQMVSTKAISDSTSTLRREMDETSRKAELWVDTRTEGAQKTKKTNELCNDGINNFIKRDTETENQRRDDLKHDKKEEQAARDKINTTHMYQQTNRRVDDNVPRTNHQLSQPQAAFPLATQATWHICGRLPQFNSLARVQSGPVMMIDLYNKNLGLLSIRSISWFHVGNKCVSLGKGPEPFLHNALDNAKGVREGWSAEGRRSRSRRSPNEANHEDMKWRLNSPLEGEGRANEG